VWLDKLATELMIHFNLPFITSRPAIGGQAREGGEVPLPCPPEADPPKAEWERIQSKIPPKAGERVIMLCHVLPCGRSPKGVI
jgi:hypothetical protein